MRSEISVKRIDQKLREAAENVERRTFIVCNHSVIVMIFLCVLLPIIFVYIFDFKSDPLHPDGCKLSALLTFYISSTPI